MCEGLVDWGMCRFSWLRCVCVCVWRLNGLSDMEAEWAEVCRGWVDWDVCVCWGLVDWVMWSVIDKAQSTVDSATHVAGLKENIRDVIWHTWYRSTNAELHVVNVNPSFVFIWRIFHPSVKYAFINSAHHLIQPCTKWLQTHLLFWYDVVLWWKPLLTFQFQCCGVGQDGFKDWNNNMYFRCNETNPSHWRCSVPFSCCINPTDIQVNRSVTSSAETLICV